MTTQTDHMILDSNAFATLHPSALLRINQFCSTRKSPAPFPGSRKTWKRMLDDGQIPAGQRFGGSAMFTKQQVIDAVGAYATRSQDNHVIALEKVQKMNVALEKKAKA